MVAKVTAVVGWCLCLALVKGSYMPADMNRTIQNLLDHYVSTGSGFGGAVKAVAPSPSSGGAVTAT